MPLIIWGERCQLPRIEREIESGAIPIRTPSNGGLDFWFVYRVFWHLRISSGLSEEGGHLEILEPEKSPQKYDIPGINPSKESQKTANSDFEKNLGSLYLWTQLFSKLKGWVLIINSCRIRKPPYKWHLAVGYARSAPDLRRSPLWSEKTEQKVQEKQQLRLFFRAYLLRTEKQ